MIDKLIKYFWKENPENDYYIPPKEKDKFILKLGEIEVGCLECRDGLWVYNYLDSFKEIINLHAIPGFPDLNKEYTSKSLWPFFQIRIPGLGQPAIKEILLKEQIDKGNELALLKRFGFKTMANPYTLILL